MCYTLILLWTFELCSTEFYVDSTIKRIGWFCDRLYSAIVSLTLCLSLHRTSNCVLFVFVFSVTLYAEFLPTKQRAKCVVLLDVSC